MDAIGLELSKHKTFDPRKSPTIIGDYSAGYETWMVSTDSNWQIGDMVCFQGETYTIIEQPWKNKIVLDRPLVKPVEHGMLEISPCGAAKRSSTRADMVGGFRANEN